jgi:hypothetical protein
MSPSVGDHRCDSLPQAVCRRQVAPGTYRHVGHLKEGEIQRRERVAACEDPASILVVLVIRIPAGQQNAGVQEPEMQDSAPPQPTAASCLDVPAPSRSSGSGTIVSAIR